MPVTEAQAHALVARFMQYYNYNTTLEAFQEEAAAYFTDPSQTSLPSNDLDTVLQAVSQLTLGEQRTVTLPPCDGHFCSTLHTTHDHWHGVNILTVSSEPTNNIVATSAIDKTVKVHHLDGSQPAQVYRHHDAPVLSIAFHPAYTNLMLTTSMDGSAALVDLSRQNPDDALVQRFRDHQRYVVQGVFSPSTSPQHYLCTASYDRTVRVYHWNDPDGDVHYQSIGKVGPFAGNVESICFLPRSPVDAQDAQHMLVAVQNDNYLHVLSLQPQGVQLTRKINMNANGDDWISFSPVWISMYPAAPTSSGAKDDRNDPLGSLVLVSTNHSSGRMILLDTTSGKQIQNYYVHPSNNEFLTRRHVFHPSGTCFYAIGSELDNAIKVVETGSGQVVASLTGHSAMIRSLTLHHDHLLTCGYDHTVKLWGEPFSQQNLR
ncbi:WD40 repeat-like protein [Hesseltinella vesiculosa]|uniref:WD40 repeat-like protein n=1 Tax=Hesseltinella vesiculosa TaxID=101127 RepID=A0A1X2GCN9_9FUNG|nr:WD40 repeat-like protein [Hesseltinella vesiculosa]